MSRRWTWVLLGTLASACEAEHHPGETGKRAMFGDPGLLPTREGERARRELAIAGELERAIAGLGFTAVRVDVELREPVDVIVVAHRPPTELPAPEAAITELARAIIPELAAEHLHLRLLAPEPAQAGPEHPSGLQLWALMLACIGFGLSLGMLGERLRSQR